ncbi:hypothetical protein CLV51_1011589 [Chitinophaga niastensis]|uniref:AAA ATPase-like protein n=2 Tax=Chitinophaga niastensis TaxID=536980 RepID=A0A2P8HVN1_CHINA|nr:hypothetical protein CLV51_1011589 [Chitinophaga niastensis]
MGAIYFLVMSILLYNPDRKNKTDFIAEFVIRTKIFEEILADIKSGKMITPEQHYLLFGQRGAGKTTMLLRLKYAVEDDPKLSKWLIPVVFSEEQYNIGELGNLWERVAEHLEDYYGFDGVTKEIEQYIEKDNYEEASLKILIKHLDQYKKKMILFVDNIGQLLAKFSELEVRRLREVLQTLPYFRLIAGSPVALESILEYQQPLYEFFKVIQLKGLTDEESIVLLRKLAVLHHEEDKIERIIAKSPSRITTLRTLSGGVPRTMVLLFQVFVDSEYGNALSDLEKVLDAVTPLYKHRMDDLPPQQQKIVDAVALHWEAISVKDLSKQVRLDSKLVSAQLRQLEKNQVIEKRVTKTKNHIYLLQERFFNIWYLMRYGRKQDRNKVIWLVKFLEAWCDKQEIEQRIKDYVEKAKEGLLDNNVLDVYGHAYTFFEDINPETKFLLKESTPHYISSNIYFTETDFYSLLNKALHRKDYDAFVRIAVSKNISQNEERYKFYEYIRTHLYDMELCMAIRAGIGNRIGLTGRGEHQVAYLYIVTMFIWSRELLYRDHEVPDIAASVVKLLVQWLPRFNFDRLTINEESDFYGIILTLLKAEYYQLALKIFSSIPFLCKDQRIMYLLTKYMASGKAEDTFLSVGSEYREAILMCLKRMSEVNLKLARNRKK